MLSEVGVFEELDFNGNLVEGQRREMRLRVKSDGQMDGFMLWIRLDIEEGYALDSLLDECAWLPLYVPAFDEPFEVRAGDLIQLECETRISDNGVNPDYKINGRVRRSNGVEVTVKCELPHHGQQSERREFYRKLYGSLRREAAEGTEVGTAAEENRVAAGNSASGNVEAVRAAVTASEPGGGEESNEIAGLENNGLAGRTELTSAELRSFLEQQLPSYMVPSSIVLLERLPLNAHGKVDVDLLPAPTAAEPPPQDEKPHGGIEEVVAGIWSEVLGVARVGRQNSFFGLGGHSLQAMQVVARVREAFNIELSLRSLVEAPTLADFARVVLQQQIEQSDDEEVSQILGELSQISDEEVRSMLGD
jgi:acyl carrier protein